MCGDYNSVIGMNKINSLNRFLKKDLKNITQQKEKATLCGLIVECNIKMVWQQILKTFIHGGELIK